MKTVAKNRRARFDYDIAETLLAGIMLTGQEAKSCRDGQVDLSGAYVSYTSKGASIKHLKIMPYRFASGLDAYEPGRQRTLLLKKAEIEKLQSLANEKGVTVIPLEVHAGKHIKILLGIARGRKTVDKRHLIKQRDIEKKMRRGEEV